MKHYGIRNCRDAMGQLAGAYPQSVNVTPEERESIERVSPFRDLFATKIC